MYFTKTGEKMEDKLHKMIEKKKATKKVETEMKTAE